MADVAAKNTRHIVYPPRLISRAMREGRQRHKSMVFWLTGLSGAGKSTLAHEAERQLFEEGRQVLVLDGDRIRSGLCSDLGFSEDARRENIRRIAHAAKLFVEHGFICICSFISPTRSSRENAAKIIGASDFREILVECSLATCETRDVKGFYTLARQGVIKNYTGVSSPYEKPEQADLVINTDNCGIEECAGELVGFIRSLV